MDLGKLITIKFITKARAQTSKKNILKMNIRWVIVGLTKKALNQNH